MVKTKEEILERMRVNSRKYYARKVLEPGYKELLNNRAKQHYQKVKETKEPVITNKVRGRPRKIYIPPETQETQETN